MNIETASLCRIADYFQFNKLSQLAELIEIVDNSDAEVQPVMKYDFYQLRKADREKRLQVLEKHTNKNSIRRKRDQ